MLILILALGLIQLSNTEVIMLKLLVLAQQKAAIIV